MNSGKLYIRKFKSGDLEILQRIRAAAFEPVFRSFREILGEDISAVALATEEADQAEHLEKLCDPESPEQVYVAVADDVICGFVSVSLNHEKKTGEIGLNAVDPEYSGQGTGTELYSFALEQMKQAGMLVATVGTGGDASHAPARRAYEKAGFGPSIPSQWMYRLLRE